MKKRILVTGGAGFIGSNFSNTFNDSYDITVLDNLYLGSKDNLDPEINFIEGDATLLTDLQKTGEKFDAVVHLAGTSSAPMFNGDNFVWGYTNAIQSFTQTLEFARKAGAKKFLYASTSSLYGNNPIPLYEDQAVTPPNHYAVTKFVYELCAQCYNRVHPDMDIIGFRFMSVYGPNEEAKGQYANMISQFLWDLARDLPPVIYGDGNQFRDFTHVQDIIQGLQLAIETEKKLGARVYNIGRGESTSFNDIFTALKKAIIENKSAEVIDPETSIETVEPIYIPNPVKEGYVKGQHADISRIVDELGFQPKVTLEEGITSLVENLDLTRVKETSSDMIRHKFI